jgi:hypothetical protein
MIATVRHVTREGRRLAADRLLRGPLPRTLDGVGTELLSELLGRRVTSARRLGGTEGTTDRVRVALTGDGVPDSVFVKTASHDLGTRLFGGLAGLGENEVRFYNDRPDVEAPYAHAAVFDGHTGRFLLVLEDLEARGARFVDTTTPLSVDEAAAALDALRAVHAAPAPSWALRNSDDPMLPVIARALGPLSKRVEGVPEAAWVLKEYPSVARALDDGPLALLHGDPHPGNLYLVGDRVGLLDWQVVRRGNPLRDVTYLMVLGLTPEDRAKHERDLLAHYGTADWDTYRRMVAYVYVATTFTSGLGGLQGTSIADEGFRRACVALRELETLSALAAVGLDGH